jgi:hypothetical protein
MSICAFVPRVFKSLGPHATLQIVLSAVVTSELMLSSQGREPQSSHRTFLPVLLPRPRQEPPARSALPRERFRSLTPSGLAGLVKKVAKKGLVDRPFAILVPALLVFCNFANIRRAAIQ